MENNSYHHGDLKHELMEKGLVLINKYGEDNLSLRKLAAECGVSNAAPYAHFENKEDLISEIQNYVMGLFTAQLKNVVSACSESKDIFMADGRAVAATLEVAGTELRRCRNVMEFYLQVKQQEKNSSF